MVGKRSGVDFSNHEVNIIKSEGLLVHHFKKPNTIMQSIKFINTNGVMVVTGDYGNWVFCREFHPSSEGVVSDHYWIEKLTISSSQTPTVFDNESTKKEIKEGLNGSLEEYGYIGDDLSIMKEYYTKLLDYVDLSEWEYVSFAYNGLPNFLCAEEVPMLKDTKIWLKIIFDAFDEICNRMNKKVNN